MARHSVPGPGARRTRLVLEAPVETANSIGGASIGYSAIATLWGEIDASTGRESSEGERLTGETLTRITVPFRTGIDARMRFRQGLRIFAIRAAFDPDGKRRITLCQTVEITP
ncbi:COG5614 Bacteriophage head-tail adaptor [Rhabdaerophilaceae bacterium]